MAAPALPARFRRAPYAQPGELRRDPASDFAHVIGVVSLPGSSGTRTELVVGIDHGHVIRAILRRDSAGLPPRAQAQLAYHVTQVPTPLRIDTGALYLFDVQVVEHAPDEPGANDPLYLYGVLRGPYPAGLTAGVCGIEGQLATTRADVLAGLVAGLPHALRYRAPASASHCAPAVLAGCDLEVGDATVLAYALPPPLGRDDTIANDREAGQLFHDVIGALRRDLGDDLATDPVPVPDRAAYVRELVTAGWQVSRAVARKQGRRRLASLFTPASTQHLPDEALLADYAALVPPLLARLPAAATRDAQAIAERMRRTIARPVAPPPLPPRAATRPGTVPPPTPAARPQPIDFLRWVTETVTAHHAPGTKAPRVTSPARSALPKLAAWLLDLTDQLADADDD